MFSLNEDAFSVAIDAANEASKAGMDNQEQLYEAIKAYVLFNDKSSDVPSRE